MTEDVARTVHLSRQLGEPDPDRAGGHRFAVRALPERLRPAMRKDSPVAFEGQQVWFLTGSQNLYGEETLQQVADAVAAGWPPPWTTPPRCRCRSSGSRCSRTPGRSVRAMGEANEDPACLGVITWMHTFSPAKMWISGLDALRKPLLHLHTQADAALPWATIDMDFMNLNQAAHGDREYGFILTRLGAAADDGRRARLQPRRARGVGSWARRRPARPARGPEAGPVRRQHAQRRGDRGRQGRGRDPLRHVGEHLGRERPGRRGGRGGRTRRRRADRGVRRPLRLSADVRPAATQHDARYQARIEAALRSFLVDGGFGAFTTNFEDLGGLRQLPGLAVQRLMADGYGFGGEGDWKTSALLRVLKVAGAGLPGGTSFMEDYTYDLDPGHEKILGAHMLEVCPTISGEKPRLEVHPLGIGGREDPARLVFTAAPARGVVVGWSDLGDRFRWVANEIDVVEPSEPLPNLPVARAVWEPRPDFATATEGWLTAGGPHHTVLTTSWAPTS